MKKVLTIFVVAMAILGLFCSSISAAGYDRNIGSSFSISGMGIIDALLEVNTDDNYSGLSLSQNIYTPSLGLKGPSLLAYSSVFELGMYNVSGENRTLDLTYSEDGLASNVRHTMNIKNYQIGSVAGFLYTGNGTQNIEAYSDNTLSEIAIDGMIEGEMRLSQKTVDPITGVVLSRDVTEFEGNYDYSWSTYSQLIDYPASKGLNDWLLCP
jgi:hypothetical protein